MGGNIINQEKQIRNLVPIALEDLKVITRGVENRDAVKKNTKSLSAERTVRKKKSTLGSRREKGNLGPKGSKH